MEKREFVILIVGILLFTLIFIILVVLVSYEPQRGGFSLPDHLDALDSTACRHFAPSPLILISLDGFRPDYFDKGVTPTLDQMRKKGVSAPYISSVFPSLTFPNHYSIVTGLYPEWHGIISNSFFDPKLQKKFSYNTPVSREGHWWGGEPIWNTLAKNDLKSATYFWVGSEAPIHGQHPTYWFKYNQSIPLYKRPAQILEWLSLPAKDRPAWISLYSHEPDKAGHINGPDSEQVADKLRKVDEMVTLLLEGLQKKNLLPCVNFLVVSDHGMASTGEEKVVHLDKLMPKDVWERIYFSPGALGRISLKPEYEGGNKDIEKYLSCQKDFLMFRREELPKRLHYAKDERVGDYVLLPEEGLSLSLDSDFFMEGIHGYDNHKSSMQAIFLAYGPAFKENYEVAPFKNIELYNLMCHLLGVNPAPNNGTAGLLDTILKQPTPPSQKNYSHPLILKLEEDQWRHNYDAFKCYQDSSTIESLQKLLRINDSQLVILEKRLLPWGSPHPQATSANFSLLFHNDHVTGYSSEAKTPLWTSFMVREAPSGGRGQQNAWISDIRLDENKSLPCSRYDAMLSYGPGWTLSPLFPHEYSFNELLPSLISNGVLVTNQFQKKWHELMFTLIPRWRQASKSPLNVILGPIYDHNSDGVLDNAISTDGELVAPSDYFLIITKCKAQVRNLEDCPYERIDSLAFVYPQNLTVQICDRKLEAFAEIFIADIRDIESLTGINFFSHLPFRRKIELSTKEFNEFDPTEGYLKHSVTFEEFGPRGA